MATARLPLVSLGNWRCVHGERQYIGHYLGLVIGVRFIL